MVRTLSAASIIECIGCIGSGIGRKIIGMFLMSMFALMSFGSLVAIDLQKTVGVFQARIEVVRGTLIAESKMECTGCTNTHHDCGSEYHFRGHSSCTQRATTEVLHECDPG